MKRVYKKRLIRKIMRMMMDSRMMVMTVMMILLLRLQRRI